MEYDIKQSCVVNAYNRSKVPIIRGEGVYLFDENGNRYLDFASGIATVGLGHCHPYIISKLEKQISQLFHCSNLFTIPEQERLARRLVDLTFADKVFFCSSGTEAVESAIKFIRRYYYSKGLLYKNRIITIQGGFHGRTIAAISAGGNQKSKEGFAPLLEGFDHVIRDDISDLLSAVTDQTAGILLEPIQAEGGVHILNTDYLRQIRDITRKKDILLCFDEVQCGYGRPGSLFYHQLIGVEPDLLTCAKAMGNGFPVAACLLKDAIAETITPGCHGSTYGGNPLAMVAANAVLDLMTEDGFFDGVSKVGEYLGESLRALSRCNQCIISAVRGIGCIWGVDINISAQEVVSECVRHGLLITRVSNNKTLRIVPPLIIEKSHVDDAVNILNKVIEKIL